MALEIIDLGFLFLVKRSYPGNKCENILSLKIVMNITQNDLNTFIRYRAIDHYLKEKGTACLKELSGYCIMVTGDDTITHSMIANDIISMKENDPPGLYAPISFNEKEEEYFYSDAGYSLEKIPLTNEENRLLNQCILFLDQLKTHDSLKGLKGMIQKLVNSFRIYTLNGTGKSYGFIQPEISEGAGGSQFLHPLIEAIQNKKVVRLYYLPFYEDKPYFTIIHPWLLKEYRGRWYLIGLNDSKQEIRTYGLDRIWEMHELQQEYIPCNFSPDEFFRNTIGVISPLADPPEIRIRVMRHQAQYLITQPIHESQLIEEEDEERIIFRYKVHPTYEFKSYILSLGSDARVLSPESLKKDVLRLLNDAILEYGKKE